jgi:hypothetical protein
MKPVWEVLAAQTHGDKGGETADDQTLGVDQHPLLLDLGRLCRKRLHVRISMKKMKPARTAGLRAVLNKPRARVNVLASKILVLNHQVINMVF